MADQVSGWFVPVVIAIALLAFAAWGVWGRSRAGAWPDRGRFRADHRLPCALGLTPMSIMVGVGQAAGV
jgi:Cu+-exporting ATPase